MEGIRRNKPKELVLTTPPDNTGSFETSELSTKSKIQSTSKMDKSGNNKIFNLEERTLKFAKSVKDLVRLIPKSLSNIEYSKQLIRSSSSVGANYIEANQAFTKKDLRLKIGISRKEAKESMYWLELIDAEKDSEDRKSVLINEALQLTKIFSTIQRKIKV